MKFVNLRTVSAVSTFALVLAGVVEQRAREAMAISHRAYVMAAGRVVLTDRADALLARPDLGDVFLGRTEQEKQ